MDIDAQQNDSRVQNDNQALDDAELCLVQGGSLLDVARAFIRAANDVLRVVSGGPQV